MNYKHPWALTWDNKYGNNFEDLLPFMLSASVYITCSQVPAAVHSYYLNTQLFALCHSTCFNMETSSSAQ